MKNLVVIGAGDFGRETMWIIERINKVAPTWNILGFVDGGNLEPTIDGYPVLGGLEWLSNCEIELFVVCAIASGKIKESIRTELETKKNIFWANLIDPTAIVGKGCTLEDGCIICAGSILTVDVQLGKNCIINLNCTVGHDAIIGDYCTIHPGTNISGKATIGKRCLLGTGTKVIQGVHIVEDTVLGAGAVVVKNIEKSGTYVGCPAVALGGKNESISDCAPS